MFDVWRTGAILHSVGNNQTKLWIQSKMQESYELKMSAMLGDDFGDDKEITILNRLISWKEGCIHYEADPKHVFEILKMSRRFLLSHL